LSGVPLHSQKSSRISPLRSPHSTLTAALNEAILVPATEIQPPTPSTSLGGAIVQVNNRKRTTHRTAAALTFDQVARSLDRRRRRTLAFSAISRRKGPVPNRRQTPPCDQPRVSGPGSLHRQAWLLTGRRPSLTPGASGYSSPRHRPATCACVAAGRLWLR